MIFTDRKITIRNGKSSINEPVVIYRGDYEVSIKFTIMESKFRFKSGVNLVDSEKASHGQLAILAPYGGNVFSEIVKCEDGTVTFTLTKEMIDQLEEVGLYSFQIRLFDYYRESRVSIPPVEFGIEVREPVASEDHDNEVNNAIVGYSIAKVVDPSKEDVGDTFDAKGNYNKTDWETGDRISEGKLNKIEDALDKINQNEKNDVATLDKRVTNNFNVLDSSKADKNEIFSMKNMGQDIKEAMTGGSVAVVGDNSILESNIVDGQVTPSKISNSFISGPIPEINVFEGSLSNPAKVFRAESSGSKHSEVEDYTLAHLGVNKISRHTVPVGSKSPYQTLPIARIDNTSNIDMTAIVSNHSGERMKIRWWMRCVAGPYKTIYTTIHHGSTTNSGISIELSNEFRLFEYEIDSLTGSFIFWTYIKTLETTEEAIFDIAGIQLLFGNDCDNPCAVSTHPNDRFGVASMLMEDMKNAQNDINNIEARLSLAKIESCNLIRNSIISPETIWRTSDKYSKATLVVADDLLAYGIDRYCRMVIDTGGVGSGNITYVCRCDSFVVNASRAKFRCMLRSNHAYTLNVGFQYSNTKTTTVELDPNNKDLVMVEHEINVETGQIGSVSFFIYCPSSAGLIANTYIDVVAPQILINDDCDKDCIISVHPDDDKNNYPYFDTVTKRIDAEVDDINARLIMAEQQLSLLAIPAINVLQGSLTNPFPLFRGSEAYCVASQVVSKEFKNIGVEAYVHCYSENGHPSDASNVVYFNRITGVNVSASVKNRMKFKCFLRSNGSNTVSVLLQLSGNTTNVKSIKMNPDAKELQSFEYEIDLSLFTGRSLNILIYVNRNISSNNIQPGTYLDIIAPQVLLDDDCDSTSVVSIHPDDNYYDEDDYVKVEKEIIYPPKVYSVANDLDSERNYTVPIYVDHCLNTCGDQTIHFTDSGMDYTLISPDFAEYDGYENAINHGVDVYTEIIKKTIESDKFLFEDVSMTHISTKASVGANKHPMVLTIGDSITCGVGNRYSYSGAGEGTPYPWWVHLKNLFDMDKIDAGNNPELYNCTCLGYCGMSEGSGLFKAGVEYKGVTTSSWQSSSGISSWNVTQFLRYTTNRAANAATWTLLGLDSLTGEEYTGTAAQKNLIYNTCEYNTTNKPGNPFFDNDKEGTNKFSIAKFIERYRTMDDDGNKLTLGDPNLGTLISSQDAIDKINVCTPTHVIIQHGRNSEGQIEQYIKDILEMVRAIKEELPDVKVGVCIPADRAGTFFPKRYPNVKGSRTQGIELAADGRNAYTLSKRLIEEYADSEEFDLIPNYFVAPTAMGFPLRRTEVPGLGYVYYPYGAGGLASHPGFYAQQNWGYQAYAWIKNTLAE